MADFLLSDQERLSGVVAVRLDIYETNDGGWYWAVRHPPSRWSSTGVATCASECCKAIGDQLSELVGAIAVPVGGISAFLDLDLSAGYPARAR
jgi:hypothetical protein